MKLFLLFLFKFLAFTIGLVLAILLFMLFWNYAVVNAISIANEIDFLTAWMLLLMLAIFLAPKLNRE